MPTVEGSMIRVSTAQLEASGYPEAEELADYGRAPELEGISDWFNSEPQTLKNLRGKVVLIDFWTYSCINCIRTLPYLKQWYSDYADDGFVLLGVHSPEFAFEKEPGNVADAIEDFEIDYPVALDPEFATWENFYNRYWPAHYLIDRDGVLRSVHYGEGAYERTENEIRHLLSLPVSGEDDEEQTSFVERTPETYLGYQRADRFAGAVGGRITLVPDESALYEPAGEPPLDWWSYRGHWNVQAERAEAGAGASIELHYRGADLHIVAGPGASDQGTITIRSLDGVRTLTVDEHRLYTLRSGKHIEEMIQLEISPGVEVYSFTFG